MDYADMQNGRRGSVEWSRALVVLMGVWLQFYFECLACHAHNVHAVGESADTAVCGRAHKSSVDRVYFGYRCRRGADNDVALFGCYRAGVGAVGVNAVYGTGYEPYV